MNRGIFEDMKSSLRGISMQSIADIPQLLRVCKRIHKSRCRDENTKDCNKKLPLFT